MLVGGGFPCQCVEFLLVQSCTSNNERMMLDLELINVEQLFLSLKIVQRRKEEKCIHVFVHPVMSTHMFVEISFHEFAAIWQSL